MDDANAEKHVEYVVCYSTQHARFDVPDDAEDYFWLNFADEVLPIEFYLNGEKCFGGELRRADCDKLLPDCLAERFCIPKKQLSLY